MCRIHLQNTHISDPGKNYCSTVIVCEDGLWILTNWLILLKHSFTIKFTVQNHKAQILGSMWQNQPFGHFETNQQ